MQQSSDEKNPSAFMTYAEVSHSLGVKTGTLYAWVSRKMIPFVRVGPRVVRFRQSELDAWLEEHSVRPGRKAR